MITQQDLENRLTQLSHQLPSDPGLRQRIMRAVEIEPAPASRRSVYRTRIAGWGVGLAACLAMGVAIWWTAFGTGPGNLYGHVMAALEDVRTLHATGKRYRDAQWVKAVEVYYERGAGVYEWSQHRGRTSIRIDDGKREWRYDDGQKTVRLGKSTDPLGAVKRILRDAVLRAGLQRDASGDMVINGVQCQHYAQVNAAKTMRQRAWIDPDKRIRRWEENVFRDGAWRDDELCEVEYGVEVDRKLFAPQFGPDVRIMDAGKVEQRVAEDYSLKQAKWQKEVMGLILAVHKVERTEDGWIYVVSSLRPTEQTLAQIERSGSTAYPEWLGSYHLDTSFHRDTTDPNRMWSYQMLGMAWAYDRGVQVRWTLLKPSGPWPAEFQDRYDFSARVMADFGWRKKRESQGQEVDQTLKSLAALPIAPRKGVLADVAAEVYGQAEWMEPGVQMTHLELPPIPFTDAEMEEEWRKGTVPRGTRMSHGHTEKPSRISLKEFQEATEGRAKELAGQ